MTIKPLSVHSILLCVLINKAKVHRLMPLLIYLFIFPVISHHDMVAVQLEPLPGVGVGSESPHNRPRCQWGRADRGGRSEYKYCGVREQRRKQQKNRNLKRVKKHMAALAARCRWDTCWRLWQTLEVEPQCSFSSNGQQRGSRIHYYGILRRDLWDFSTAVH